MAAMATMATMAVLSDGSAHLAGSAHLTGVGSLHGGPFWGSVRGSVRPPMRRPAWQRLAGLLAAWVPACCTPVGAAPLDTLLSARPERLADTAYLELAVDRVRFTLEPADPTGAGGLGATGAGGLGATGASAAPRNGGYRGLQLAGAWRASERWWLMAGLWQRDISNGVDNFRYQSGLLAGQVRLSEGSAAPAGASATGLGALWATAPAPTVALRLAAWGNQAAITESTTPVRVPGAVLDTVTVTRPADQQLQADLIATWALSSALDVNAALGAGISRLSYGALTATTTRNGCPYQLSFNGNDIFGTLARPCNGDGGGVIRQFYDRSGDYGVDVSNEIAWRGHFVQAGLNAAWRQGPWALRAGYLYHTVQRTAVDAILAQRGAPVHRHNHVMALESAYHFTPYLSGVVRGQFSNRLFFNDLPVTYNSATSGNFGSRYAVLSLGLRAGF